jgi:hypothetical protein
MCSSNMSTRAPVASQRAITNFCRLPPDRLAMGVRMFGGRICRSEAYFRASAQRAPPRNTPKHAKCFWFARPKFCSTDTIGTIACSQRSLGIRAIPARIASLGSLMLTLDPATRISSPVRSSISEDGAHDRRSTRANQARKAYDLAGTNRQINISETGG